MDPLKLVSGTQVQILWSIFLIVGNALLLRCYIIGPIEYRLLSLSAAKGLDPRI